MTRKNLQLGGGYVYQWECAALLALNYFFRPKNYNPDLHQLITEFLGQPEEMQLEGELTDNNYKLEDINLYGRNKRVLIQVKSKTDEISPWKPSNPAILKALYRFYNSGFLTEKSSNTHFVIMSNCGLISQKEDQSQNNPLKANQDKLFTSLSKWADKEKGKSLEHERFVDMISHSSFIHFMQLDAVRANTQSILEGFGCYDYDQAHAIVINHFTDLSTTSGGGLVTPESLTNLINLQESADLHINNKHESLTDERKLALKKTIASLLDIPFGAVRLHYTREGSIIARIGFPAYAVRRLKYLMDSDSRLLQLLRIDKININPDTPDVTKWEREPDEKYSIWYDWVLEDEKIAIAAQAKIAIENYLNKTILPLVTQIKSVKLLEDNLDKWDKSHVRSEVDAICSKAVLVEKYLETLLLDTPRKSLAISKSKVLLDQLIQRLVKSLMPIAKERNVGIFIDKNIHYLPPLYADEHKLEIVFFNILHNAVKYSFSDTSIRIKGWSIQDAVELTITNIGIGLPIGESELIFQSGYRSSKQKPDIQGTGLGLYVARKITEDHGGKISVRSSLHKKGNPDTYTVAFIITLPTLSF